MHIPQEQTDGEWEGGGLLGNCRDVGRLKGWKRCVEFTKETVEVSQVLLKGKSQDTCYDLSCLVGCSRRAEWDKHLIKHKLTPPPSEHPWDTAVYSTEAHVPKLGCSLGWRTAVCNSMVVLL